MKFVISPSPKRQLKLKMTIRNNSRFLLVGLLLMAFGGFLSAQDMAPLPNFKFTSTTGESIGPASLEQGKAVVVVYFDPDCDHCQQQAEWTKEEAALLKDVQMVWVSWGEEKLVKEFETKYFSGVEGPKIIVTRDTDYAIDNYFGYSEVPSIYVYNKEWKRTKSLKKETKPSEFISFTR